MVLAPLETSFVDLKKVNILSERLLIGIDSGISLTKVVFLPKGNEKQFFDIHNEFLTLQYGLFNNENFKEAMQWVLENAFIPSENCNQVHITGRGMTHSKIEILESTLGLKSKFVDKTLSLIVGLKIGLEDIGFINLTAPNVEIENMGEVKSTSIDRLYNGMKEKLNRDLSHLGDNKSIIYPSLIQVCGSDSSFVYFNHEGKGEVLRCQSVGGLTMLGIGKCLLDTNNYDEIVQLAEKGDRRHVDTQTKDILPNAKDTPYGIFPPEMPLFPFGKSMDFNTGLEDYKREDVAASLVAWYCILIITEYFHMCRENSITKIYLTGNVHRYTVFQKMIKQFLTILPPLYEMQILNFGYCRALGAMLSDNQEIEKHCVNNEL